MKNLNIKVVNKGPFEAYLLVDGKNQKIKKNQFGSLMASVESEKDEVEVVISEWNDYKSRTWFVTNIIFFVISVFGIFDIKTNKRFCSIDFKAKIKMDKEDNNLTFTYNRFEDGKIAIVHEGDCNIEIFSNKYFIDTVAKRRYKIMRWIKLLIWLLTIMVIVLFFINK